MRTLIGAMAVLLAAGTAEAGQQEAIDRAAISHVVAQVATLADAGDFEALGALYAPLVEVDYTSLAGGEAETKPREALMAEWAGVLPGFDQTFHAVSNIQVSSNGSTATATADVVADHYVDGLSWQVAGDYVYRLEKSGGAWRITAHQFNFRAEEGTRDVFGLAVRRLKGG